MFVYAFLVKFFYNRSYQFCLEMFNYVQFDFNNKASIFIKCHLVCCHLLVILSIGSQQGSCATRVVLVFLLSKTRS